MAKAIPVNSLQFNNSGLAGDYMDIGWRTNSDDISMLKKALISVFNETFSNKLFEANLVNIFFLKNKFS